MAPFDSGVGVADLGDQLIGDLGVGGIGGLHVVGAAGTVADVVAELVRERVGDELVVLAEGDVEVGLAVAIEQVESVAHLIRSRGTVIPGCVPRSACEGPT